MQDTATAATPNAPRHVRGAVRARSLERLARGLHGHDVDAHGIVALLELENRRRFDPPLPRAALVEIATSAIAEESEPFELPRMTARELCSLPDPPETDKLVGPLVVRGQRCIIGGATGEGKSTLAFQAVAATVNGGRLIDWEAPGGARALIVDLEQGTATIKRRLEEVGLSGSDAVQIVLAQDGLCLGQDERHVAALEELLRDGRFDVVLIDPFYKLAQIDSNEERAVVDVMRIIDRWRAEFGFALILAAHSRKPQVGSKRPTINDVFGSSAFVRGAEVVVMIRRLRPGYAQLLVLKDRQGDLPVGSRLGLIYNRDNGFVRDENDGRRETAAEKIEELLAADPTMSVGQLATAADVTERTVRRVLKSREGSDENHARDLTLELDEELMAEGGDA